MRKSLLFPLPSVISFQRNSEGNNSGMLTPNLVWFLKTIYVFSSLIMLLSLLGLVLGMHYLFVQVPSFKNHCSMTYARPNYYVLPMLLPSVNKSALVEALQSSDQENVTETEKKDLIEDISQWGSSRFAYKYRLLRFCNGPLKPAENPLRPVASRNVVLFVPGNLGSYSQARGIGGELSTKNPR